MAKKKQNNRQTKPIDEFCEIWDEIFNCREEYGCSLTCPLNAFVKALERSVDGQEAMRAAVKRYIRHGMSYEAAVKIIEGKFGLTLEEIQRRVKEHK